MRRAALVAAVLAVGLALAASPSARADGDPASDVLIMQDAYYPYVPPTAPRLRRALDGVLAQARRSGYAVKVALIESDRDLGVYPSLFNDANRYASVLARELPSNRHGRKLEGQRILVVMPAGFGGSNLGEHVDEALSPVRVQASAHSDGLAVAAIAAVARLATANGHRVATPPEAKLRLSASSAPAKRGGGPSAAIFLLPAVVAFAGLYVAGRIRSRRA